MQRTALLTLLLFAGATTGWAQDVLTVGSGIANAGGTAAIPVSIRDLSGTALGVDAGTGNRIQGFAFKVLFPTDTVLSVTFSRAGIATTVTPLYESALQGSGWSACIVSFNESSNPVAFTLDDTAPGDTIGMLTVTLRGDAAVGSTAALVVDPGSAMLSNQAGSVRETVAGGTLSLVNGSITVSALAAPAGVVATAQGTSQVNVSWSAVGGADHYEVWRSSFGGEYAIVGSPSAAAFTDSTVAADTTYLYRVRAVDPSDDPSGFSAIDPATNIVFTDDPLTTIKLVHITQLRTAVNAFRAAADLEPLDADPTVASGAVVRAQHVLDLRLGLNEARSVLGLSALSYSDPTLTGGVTKVKAAHVTELRDDVY